MTTVNPTVAPIVAAFLNALADVAASKLTETDDTTAMNVGVVAATDCLLAGREPSAIEERQIRLALEAVKKAVSAK